MYFYPCIAQYQLVALHGYARVRVNPWFYLSVQGYFFHQKGQDDVKANPFVQQQGGNNSFTPQKLGSKQQVSDTLCNPRNFIDQQLTVYTLGYRYLYNLITLKSFFRHDEQNHTQTFFTRETLGHFGGEIQERELSAFFKVQNWRLKNRLHLC